MISFKINEYITLKLEDKETNIYINDIRFIQCKRLILNIPIKDIRIYDDIDSIDEASEYYDHYLFQNQIQKREGEELNFINHSYDFSSQVEFWAHCSNLQVWYEHNYDTRLLHSNLAFPLLKRLTESGDPIAKKVFKEEIARRFETGFRSVLIFLINERFHLFLDDEELRSIFDGSNLRIVRFIFDSLTESDYPSLKAAITVSIYLSKDLQQKFISALIKDRNLINECSYTIETEEMKPIYRLLLIELLKFRNYTIIKKKRILKSLRSFAINFKSRDTEVKKVLKNFIEDSFKDYRVEDIIHLFKYDVLDILNKEALCSIILSPQFNFLKNSIGVIKANPRKNFLVTKLLKQLLKTRDKNIAKIVKKQILEKVELSNIFKSIELDLFEEVNLLEVELGDNINFLSNNVGRELILLLEETSISDIRDLLEISLCLLGSGVIGPIFNLLISDISREKKVFYSAVLTSDLEIEPLMLKRMYFKFIKTIKKSNSEYSSFLIEFGFTILTKEEFWSLFQYGEYILKLEKALNYDIYLLVPEGMHDEMVLYVGIEDLKITELYIEGLVGNDTGQPIVTLPSCIKDIKTLRKIYILSSGLYRIPNWIDQLLNLEEIYISHNNLQLITATIGNLNQLKVLEIKWEIQLNQLPDSIKNLNTLEILNLIGLKFQEVPCSIRSLTNLRELSLINCSNLAKLPIWISELSNLESLYIKGTRIKEIPDSCVGIVKDLDPGA